MCNKVQHTELLPVFSSTINLPLFMLLFLSMLPSNVLRLSTDIFVLFAFIPPFLC